MSPKDLLTREFLEEQFIALEKSENRIADENGLSSPFVVRYYLLKYGLTRPRLQPAQRLITKEFLEEEYIVLNKGTRQIAEETGYSRGTIRKALRLHGIPTKKREDVFSSKQWLPRMPNQREGHEEITGKFWTQLVRSAQKRKLPFELSIEEAWDLFLAQDRKCALSGVELRFQQFREDSTAGTASLDRIDSDDYYHIDNVQWIHKRLNMMKGRIADEEFIALCASVTDYQRGENAGDIPSEQQHWGDELV